MWNRDRSKRAFGILAVSLALILIGQVAAALALTRPQNVGQRLWQELAGTGASDLVVEFTEQADLTPAYTMTWDDRGYFVYDTLKQVAQKSQAEAMALLDKRGIEYHSFIAGNDLYVFGSDINSTVDLSSLPKVKRVRAPITIELDPVTERPPALDVGGLSWGIQDTGADQFWSEFGQGAAILVANIDTGVQWSHPGLINEYKCKDDPTSAACWKDPLNLCGNSGPCDNIDHGTHTMGTMVADDDPTLAYMAGMAPDAKWIACKGCETNNCTDYSLSICADWILAPGDDPANRPHIVNNSWGGDGGSEWYLDKVNAWRAAGIFPAFSAGNNGDISACGNLGSPGDYQESFATAAHKSDRTIASFSSKGPSEFGDTPFTKPNISAPGYNICSTVPGSAYECGWNGTSMASPHTAGAVALLWSCNPSLVGDIDTTFQILQSTADTPPEGSCGAPTEGEGNYTFGYGYLDVYEAGLQYCASITVAPVPDVKVDGSDGPLLVSPNQEVELTVDLKANDYVGGTVDFLLFVYSPSYGIFPFVVGQPSLADVDNVSVGSVAFPAAPTGGPAVWVYFFILDDNPNGAVDGTVWEDHVIMVSTPQ